MNKQRQTPQDFWESGVDCHGEGSVQGALTHFQQAYELAIESGDRSIIAASQAAVRMYQEIGEHMDQGQIPFSGCGVFNVVCKESSIMWFANPAFCTALHQFRDAIDNQKANLPAWQPFLPYGLWAPGIEIPIPVTLNKSWSGEEMHDVAIVSSTIESLTETVEVPAGIFNNCLKLKNVIKEDESKNRHASGTTVMWFAPNVGLVKEQYGHDDGDETLTQLTSYSVKNEMNESFPYFSLQAGNYWQYQGTKRSSVFVTKSIYWIAEEGVEFEKGIDRWYIPYYNYALKVIK